LREVPTVFSGFLENQDELPSRDGMGHEDGLVPKKVFSDVELRNASFCIGQGPCCVTLKIFVCDGIDEFVD
jgi:hypothetical protein